MPISIWRWLTLDEACAIASQRVAFRKQSSADFMAFSVTRRERERGTFLAQMPLSLSRWRPISQPAINESEAVALGLSNPSCSADASDVRFVEQHKAEQHQGDQDNSRYNERVVPPAVLHLGLLISAWRQMI